MITKHLTLLILVSLFLQYPKQQKELKGKWEIKIVTLKEDTLYFKDSIKVTARFYSNKLNHDHNSNSDTAYINRCISSTYNTYKSVTLTIDKNTLSLTPVKPCLDFIDLPKIESENFIFNTKQNILKTNELNLSYSTEKDQLKYRDSILDYTILFRRTIYKD